MMFISVGKMPKSLHSKIISITSQSKERIMEFWGEMRSKPVFIYCATEEEFRHFGENRGTPAMIHTTFLGAYMVMNPDGTNVDVVSHEICHAELSERLHWFKKHRGIPAWFDEGLALMVDYRFPQNGGGHSHADYRNHWIFNDNSVEELPLDQFEDIDDFFAKDDFWIELSYLRSGLEVSRWMEIVGDEGLHLLIQKINKGSSFEEAYEMIEDEFVVKERD